MTQPSIVVPIALQHTQEAICTVPWFVWETEYQPAQATYKPLVNGEEAFREVHLAIEGAKKSVDIICWGFQPSMYFIRDGKAPSIGELLKLKAAEGVQVRILGWEMPFNSAGVAGEANLPGKGAIRVADRAGQSATDKQYADDREWFAKYSYTGNLTDLALGFGANVLLRNEVRKHKLQASRPLFVSRGFGPEDRAEIAYRAALQSTDRNISWKTVGVLAGAVTHHQKTVLVDYELPEHAIGFVMGHNMLDEYWDTDQHSARGRTYTDRPASNTGACGHFPRQDISSLVTGPILEHLHHNFATAWKRETGQDLLVERDAMAVARQLKFRPECGTPLMAQLLRTQAQERKRDIEQLYLKVVNNATQFIYIENQYFRWPPLAEAIKAAAQVQTNAGSDPGKHGALHLFVVTNVTDAGIGAGTVNTQRMLQSLGREDTIPELTKLRRIDEAQARAQRPLGARVTDSVLKTTLGLSHALGGPDLASRIEDEERSRQASLDAEIESIKTTPVIRPPDRPGLKVHVCSLVSPDSRPDAWTPVYIHSKLMIVNDVFTTHGSANINTRSMQVDSELNIAHEWMSVTQALRRRLWDLHTDKRGAQDDPAEAFDAWQKIIEENKKRQEDKENKLPPYAPLVEFHYDKANWSDID